MWCLDWDAAIGLAGRMDGDVLITVLKNLQTCEIVMSCFAVRCANTFSISSTVLRTACVAGLIARALSTLAPNFDRTSGWLAGRKTGVRAERECMVVVLVVVRSSVCGVQGKESVWRGW